MKATLGIFLNKKLAKITLTLILASLSHLSGFYPKAESSRAEDNIDRFNPFPTTQDEQSKVACAEIDLKLVKLSTQQPELERTKLLACSKAYSPCKFSFCKEIGISNLSELELTDDMLWVANIKDCEELSAEFKSRFEEAEKTPEVINQLDILFELICSEKFEHCELASCENRKSERAQKRYLSSLDKWASFVVDQKASQREQIIEASEQELTEGRTSWRKFRITETSASQPSDLNPARVERERPSRTRRSNNNSRRRRR